MISLNLKRSHNNVRGWDLYIHSKCVEARRGFTTENKLQRSVFFRDEWLEDFTSESVVAVRTATTT